MNSSNLGPPRPMNSSARYANNTTTSWKRFAAIRLLKLNLIFSNVFETIKKYKQVESVVEEWTNRYNTKFYQLTQWSSLDAINEICDQFITWYNNEDEVITMCANEKRRGKWIGERVEGRLELKMYKLS